MARLKILGRLFVLSFLVLMGAGKTVFSQDLGQEHLFTVYGIEVDVRAQSASQAKQLALQQAEEEAFRALIRRLVRQEDLGEISLREGFSPSPLVLGIEVEEERNSRVRYIGTINVTFDPREIDQFLSRQNIPFVAFAPPKTLVFPLFWKEGGYLLWGEKNPLWEIWPDRIGKNRIVNLVLPGGSSFEKTAISAAQVQKGLQPDQLKEVLRSYGAVDMMVLGVKPDYATTGEIRALKITVFRPLEGFVPETTTYRPFNGENLEDLMGRALEGFFNDMDRAWKIRATTRVTEVSELALMVPTENPATWADIKTRLAETPIVRGVRLARLAVPESYISIQFSGTQEQLALALRQKGLILFRAGRGFALVRQEDAGRYLAGRGDE